MSDDTKETQQADAGGESLMTPEELSAIFSVPSRTIIRLAKQGKMPGIKIGGKWRFKRDMIEQWMTETTRTRRDKVLIVDDDPKVREIFRGYLGLLSVAAAEADSVSKAISLLEKDEFTAILLDLVFPDGKNGASLLEWLGNSDITIPVIIITAYTDSEHIKDVLKYGTFVFLSKPVSREKLKEALASVLRKKEL